MKNPKSKKTLIHKVEPISNGLAIGRLCSLKSEPLSIPKIWITNNQISEELKTFEKAIESSFEEIKKLQSKLCQVESRDHIYILESHSLLLKDELLHKKTKEIIESEKINAAWAFDKALKEIKSIFLKMDQEYFKEKIYDLDYISDIVFRNLLGLSLKNSKLIKKSSILYLKHLSPSQLIELMKYRPLAFILDHLSINSHVSIILRSLKLPAIYLKNNIKLHDGDYLILDTEKSQLIISPSKSDLKSYRLLEKKQQRLQRRWELERRLPTNTKDGVEIKILANMEFVDELDTVRKSFCDGIGLFRSEFLLLNKTIKELDFKQQRQIYQKILKTINKEVCLRTIDLCPDKSSYKIINEQNNPALGLRAIRYSLKEKVFFREQLKAMLSLSEYENLKILIPMVSSIDELRSVKKLIKEIEKELKEEGDYNLKKIPLGAMIETPAAVLELDLLAQEVDFFSLGTNDLIQYLLAVDRNNELVSNLYHPLHPSVIRCLKQIVSHCEKVGKELNFCGELASDPFYFILFLGLGFKKFSMNPNSIPRIKKMIRSIKLSDAIAISNQILNYGSSLDNFKFLKRKMKQSFPEYIPSNLAFKNL